MANPNPDTSGLRPITLGEVRNPGGKTSAQRKLEIANAERATRIRKKLLEALEKSVTEADGKPLEAIQSDVLRLLKDSEDRGLGAPKQTLAGDPANPLNVVNRIVIEAATDADREDKTPA